MNERNAMMNGGGGPGGLLANSLNNRSAGGQNPLQASFGEGGHLHKEVILPFLVGVKCCGFYLYGTPLIYT